MKKIYAYILVSFLIIGIALISFNLEKTETKEDHIKTITTKAWNEFDVLSYSDLSDESKLYFIIANTESKNNIQKMLQKNLDDYNLKDYSLEILKENEVNKNQS